jgi:integrase
MSLPAHKVNKKGEYMKAKKLPSGQWNVLVYSHTENGKRKYESFTEPTKALAEQKAAEFKANKNRRARHDLTVGDAIDGYIKAKEAVLSPSTITRYVGMRKNNFSSIENKRIRTLTSEDLQIFVSSLSETLSTKSVRNIYGLLSASLSLYSPDTVYRVTFPAKKKYRPVSPSDDAVKLLYDNAYPRLKLCIGLGMMGLREGEITALEYSDLNGNTLHVHKDMVRNRYGKWVIKETPKTSDSDRYIDLPPFIIDLIGSGEGLIIPITPNTIAKQFIKLRHKLGLEIRFHDLRHYFASSAAVLGIPDTYTADMGGWRRGSSVMKSVYQNNIASMADYYSDKLNSHIFGKLKEDAN